ncbi:MAG: family 10 glycosylhydrolase [Pseudoflavonifractor sp.]|nr:family 10 glycosylhydrolase [Pseudoflavonifractor sp.]
MKHPVFKCLFAVMLLMALTAVTLSAEIMPKREFRGAWLQTVYRTDYAKRTTEENKAFLAGVLDRLQSAGINAVIFQVRPSADAFYDSKVETWSRYLTGKAGTAPSPAWDPLEYMVDECHRRGMELHAWINPYRVTTSSRERLPEGHVYHRHPDRFVTYGGKIYFNPGLAENRQYICDVVRDIVKRYDVDAIHLDDYFYPYPIAKKNFPDGAAYRKYGNGMKLADWRRHNVDMLIEELHGVIRDTKPWVRLGISPFGIWRNKSSHPDGSLTSGLENYGDLYADVLKWVREGWIDYMLPQVYWELDHKRASYRVLIDWWASHGYGRHMYIGQDVERTMKTPDGASPTQLWAKMSLARGAGDVHGSCWWPGYPVADNLHGIADSLGRSYYAAPALVPPYRWIESREPDAVRDLRFDGITLSWRSSRHHDKASDVVRYVVYRFDGESDIDTENPAAIVGIVGSPAYTPRDWTPGVYVVTAVDRVNNESDRGKWRLVIKRDGSYKLRH